MIERARGERVADALRRGGRVEDAVAPAQHRLVGDTPGHAEARSDVVAISVDQPAAHPGLVCRDNAIADYPRINLRDHACRRHDEAPFSVRRRISEARVEVHQQILAVNERRNQFVAQSEVESEAGTHLELVLEEKPVLEVGRVEWAAERFDKLNGIWGQANQEPGKWIGRVTARIVDTPARVLSIGDEAVCASIAHHVCPALEGVAARHPRQRVAESD